MQSVDTIDVCILRVLREIERDRGTPSPFEEDPSDVKMVAADRVRGSGGGASREHCANPRSVRDIGGVTDNAVNLILHAPGPTSLYSAGHRGPPTITGCAPPVRVQVKGAQWAVGPTRMRSI
jgi:hypothetical protein